ncbi:hypothetical protein F2Q65_01140 [Thiohalocapsa marina]|uniref:Ribosomal-protein-alanine N-acetyltransferase n=1 Tax=Thiohalocapsa marina TaxID=424902 RepID=A0A5M8FVM3_9GAMM|nr:hypothetical protein [Thiohalocapsa marina]KAA6187872.1 hypothetical protein F2Q65_01140 [Thiohalocapsa marina]
MNARAIPREPAVLLRPMQQADLPAVLAVEQAAYSAPWGEGIFRDCLWVRDNAVAIARTLLASTIFLSICV